MSHYWCPHHQVIITGRNDWDECRVRHERLPRAWAWAPDWYWHGWKTLLPAFMSSDEYGRRTLALGWTITGRIIIALYPCGCAHCDMTRQSAYFDGLDGPE